MKLSWSDRSCTEAGSTTRRTPAASARPCSASVCRWSARPSEDDAEHQRGANGRRLLSGEERRSPRRVEARRGPPAGAGRGGARRPGTRRSRTPRSSGRGEGQRRDVEPADAQHVRQHRLRAKRSSQLGSELGAQAGAQRAEQRRGVRVGDRCPGPARRIASRSLARPSRCHAGRGGEGTRAAGHDATRRSRRPRARAAAARGRTRPTTRGPRPPGAPPTAARSARPGTDASGRSTRAGCARGPGRRRPAQRPATPRSPRPSTSRPRRAGPRAAPAARWARESCRPTPASVAPSEAAGQQDRQM